ncbi:hypothetical protein JCGZ_15130 [Jatropha curcas]|uniref:DOMON domain-containing protein n=1 Tax=Jatropha curcas TaxID=180498 RepID=A0A067LKQ1_JATCU|nr:hypothetical protein JCGZ_15130 [Jatropha curcas]
MASFSFVRFLSLSLVLLISTTHALNCTSDKFNNNKSYANCSDLSTLNAHLHYTYNSSNSSLSIAFKAAPAKSNGWVAWALNLNGTGMVGAQALIGMKSSGNSMVVKKYNLISYHEINETQKLSFDVWDESAESDSSGNFVIFASVKVPADLEKVNQIWQVGPSVTNGTPAKHDFAPANIQSKGTIELKSSTTAGTGTNTTAESTNSTKNTGAAYQIEGLNVGYQIGVFVLLASVLSF